MLFGRISEKFGVIRREGRFGGVEDGKRGRKKSSAEPPFGDPR